MCRSTVLVALLAACGQITNDEVDRDSGAADTDTDADGDSDVDTDADTDSDADTDPTDADGDGVAAPEDCNDADPEVHPGVEEVCNNGIDDDCNGAPGRCTFVGDILTAGASHLDGATGDGAAYGLASGEDVDGDGRWDLAVSAPYSRAGAGDVYLSTSSADGGVLPDVAAFNVGGQYGDNLGMGLALVGDVDGDGTSDVLVGAPGRGGMGAAWLVPGDSTGSQSVDAAASAVWMGQEPGDYVGQAVAAVGDLTGDGVADIAIGSPGFDGASSDGGMVGIFAGPVSGGSMLDADAGVYGDSNGGGLGIKIVGGMDLDGDGTGDLATGVSGTFTGSVAVFLGPLSGSTVLADAQALLHGQNQQEWPYDGMSSAGDVDGDGLDDLLLGARAWSSAGNSQEGVAYLVRGVPSGESSLFLADARIYGERAGDSVGFGVSSAGDLDGDGFDDVLIGAGGDDAHGFEAGMVYVFYGPFSGNHPVSSADASILPSEPGGTLGRALVGGGDFTGDGLLDIWVGAEGANTNGAASGAAYLLPGGGL